MRTDRGVELSAWYFLLIWSSRTMIVLVCLFLPLLLTRLGCPNALVLFLCLKNKWLWLSASFCVWLIGKRNGRRLIVLTLLHSLFFLFSPKRKHLVNCVRVLGKLLRRICVELWFWWSFLESWVWVREEAHPLCEREWSCWLLFEKCFSWRTRLETMRWDFVLSDGYVCCSVGIALRENQFVPFHTLYCLWWDGALGCEWLCWMNRDVVLC